MRYAQHPLVALVLFVILGCAAEPVKPTRPLFNAKEEEKWIEVEERLARQETQIQRLTAALEASRTVGKTSAALAPRKKLPVKKLKPEAEEWDESVLEEPAKSDGDTIVDSTHENMQDYFRGLTFVEQGKNDRAISSFQKFIRENPDHVFADRAEYWILEANFRSKEYQLTVVAANRFETKYPRSFRLPDVLLKRALAQVGLGQNGEARASLRDLVKKFPANSIADTASRKLTELALSKKPPLMPSTN